MPEPRREKLLAVTTDSCIVFTAGLGLVGPGDLGLAIVLIVLSNYFFGTGENLIAAFLPEMARGDGWAVSLGWGWSLGYLGGW